MFGRNARQQLGNTRAVPSTGDCHFAIRICNLFTLVHYPSWLVGARYIAPSAELPLHYSYSYSATGRCFNSGLGVSVTGAVSIDFRSISAEPNRPPSTASINTRTRRVLRGMRTEIKNRDATSGI